MRAAVILVIGCGLTACATGGVTQVQLNAMTDKCGLDRSALQLQQDGRVRFQPSPEARFEAIDCTLVEMRKMPALKGKLGFVGNEASEEEMK